MLRYFRINDPYRLLALVGLFIVLALPLLIDTPPVTFPELKSFLLGAKVSEGFGLYYEIVDSTPPLAAWFYGLLNWVFGENITLRHICALVILFLQGAFIGFMLIDKRAFTENTYIPSLLFLILALLSFDNFSLTAELGAFGFLLLALNSLLTEIEFKVQHDATIFSIGLFVGIATLFSFSYIIYLPGVVLILILFTRNNLRKYLLMLTGFMLPHLVIMAAYFIGGHSQEIWRNFYLANLVFSTASLISFKSILILCAVPLVYLLIATVILNRDARLTKYQSQLLTAMVLWFVIGLVHVYFTPDFRAQSLLPLLPAVSFFFTHFLLFIRRRKFAEINVWILLLGVVTTLYLARYNKIEVDYSSLIVKTNTNAPTQKRLLILDKSPVGYLHNTVSPPFINWKLTREIFDHPNYYENVLLVSRLFEKDPPEIIIDPENRMEKFFDRTPALQRKYKKAEAGEWVLIETREGLL
ncbi:MAG: hypothetical protein KF845_02475 [Cyclobacteriaceae bacterium]|nr:hypothetical protein [Cyclobacteriaceae bacterium]